MSSRFKAVGLALRVYGAGLRGDSRLGFRALDLGFQAFGLGAWGLQALLNLACKANMTTAMPA